ncbi:unnamed protein product [Schistocephalus solidus]|uniref:Centrin n=1 Tax=Schistocephalus solidus TaxID=70667 RepID=A0A183T4J6_SCHSO|nr:unnamed protein product [Schistocephalus solidus]
MADGVGEKCRRNEDIKLTFKRALWPKIELDAASKKDLKRSFDLFDSAGQGIVSVDAVKVALHALGHDLTMNEKTFLHYMFPTDEIQFGEYLALLSEWIFNIDSDTDISKAFELIDTGGKGFIDMEDLRRLRDELGYNAEVTDAELADMLLGGQHKDVAEELERQYEALQSSSRHRKGQGYASQEVDMGPLGLPHAGMITRTSSDLQVEPEDLVINFSNFKRMMQMNDAPPEPI